MQNIVMRCGHSANAEQMNIDGDWIPCCVICAPKPEGYEVNDTSINLDDRIAKCSDCGDVRNSKLSLPFFEYRSEMETDKFYCGCRGWD